MPPPEVLLNPSDVFERYESAVDAIAAKGSTSDDAKLLDLSIKIFENDASRRASVDSRAAGMMSAITLAAALVTGVGFTTFKDPSGLPSTALWVMLSTLVLSLIYLTWTTILLFHIQGRVFRSTLDPSDLDASSQSPQLTSTFQRRVAVKILRYTIANYKVNNRVVAHLWVAQKCFRNALVILVIGGLIATVILVQTASGVGGGLRLAQALARGAGCRDLPSLTVDRSGRWQGLCLVAGKPSKVIVNPDGRIEFPP